MEPFIQGILACVAILGGMCAFNYWIFYMMEKRLELKLDTVSAEIHRIANELEEGRKSSQIMFREQSKRTDQLYEMFVTLVKERK